MSRYSEILAVGRQKCRSLVFDFSKLDNVDTYFVNYRIPREEHMVVYAYSSQSNPFSMEGSGTIITDQAIYIHPSHEDWAPSNRIPLSEICSYLVYQENSRDMVRLLSDRREMRIFGRTVTPGDTTGDELCELLRGLQQQLIRGNNDDKRNYELTLEWALSYVRRGFSEDGILEGKYEELLSIIEQHPAFVTDAFLLRAENEYRRCDPARYEVFLERMEGTVPRETIVTLRTPGKLFFEPYIRDIANVSAVFMTKSLLGPYLNLKSRSRLTLEEAQLLCMLCIRIEDMQLFDELLEMISPYLPVQRCWFLRSVIAKNGKNRMSGVYEMLLTGNPPAVGAMQYTDDIGLTPLHYALMIRNKDLVLEMLSMRDWGSGRGPLGRDRMVDSLYDYVFVASILYDDPDFIRQVFWHTSPDGSVLRRSIERMDNLIEISTRMKERTRENMRACVEKKSQAFKAGSKEKFENSENDITQLFREIAEYDSRIDEYQQMRSEMEDELSNMIRETVAAARARESIIREASHPFADHILRLYHEPDALLCSLADTMMDYRLYCYKDLFFLTPVYEKIDIPFFEWQSDEVTDHSEFAGEPREDEGITFENPSEKARRAYEEREREKERERKRKESRSRRQAGEQSAPADNVFKWFSSEAMADISVLKHEYRVLVKKYHPDSTGDRSSAEILRQIMDERALILDSLGDALVSAAGGR